MDPPKCGLHGSNQLCRLSTGGKSLAHGIVHTRQLFSTQLFLTLTNHVELPIFAKLVSAMTRPGAWVQTPRDSCYPSQMVCPVQQQHGSGPGDNQAQQESRLLSKTNQLRFATLLHSATGSEALTTIWSLQRFPPPRSEQSPYLPSTTPFLGDHPAKSADSPAWSSHCPFR